MSNRFDYVTGLDKAVTEKGKKKWSDGWTSRRDESFFHPLIFAILIRGISTSQNPFERCLRCSRDSFVNLWMVDVIRRNIILGGGIRLRGRFAEHRFAEDLISLVSHFWRLNPNLITYVDIPKLENTWSRPTMRGIKAHHPQRRKD